jgi:phosphohistidine phosphatase
LDLILWRHADAEDGEVDLARELSLRGHKQAERMGRWLSKRLAEGTRVVSSPAQRARQTALALGPQFTVDDRLAPGAWPSDVLAASGWPEGGSVVVVGHQPTLGRVVGQLLVGEPRDWSLRKGAIVWLRSREREGDPQVVLRAALTPELL